MIAFLLICLVPAALVVAALPIVMFGLMLETARGGGPPAVTRAAVAERARLRFDTMPCAEWS